MKAELQRGRRHRAWAGPQKRQGAELCLVPCFVTEIFYGRKPICARGFQKWPVFLQWPVHTVLICNLFKHLLRVYYFWPGMGLPITHSQIPACVGYKCEAKESETSRSSRFELVCHQTLDSHLKFDLWTYSSPYSSTLQWLPDSSKWKMCIPYPAVDRDPVSSAAQSWKQRGRTANRYTTCWPWRHWQESQDWILFVLKKGIKNRCLLHSRVVNEWMESPEERTFESSTH